MNTLCKFFYQRLLYGFVVLFFVALAALSTPSPVYADDCELNPWNAADCMRTPRVRRALNTIATALGMSSATLMSQLMARGVHGKLNRYLARTGKRSRRKAEEWVKKALQQPPTESPQEMLQKLKQDYQKERIWHGDAPDTAQPPPAPQQPSSSPQQTTSSTQQTASPAQQQPSPPADILPESLVMHGSDAIKVLKDIGCEDLFNKLKDADDHDRFNDHYNKLANDIWNRRYKAPDGSIWVVKAVGTRDPFRADGGKDPYTDENIGVSMERVSSVEQAEADRLVREQERQDREKAQLEDEKKRLEEQAAKDLQVEAAKKKAEIDDLAERAANAKKVSDLLLEAAKDGDRLTGKTNATSYDMEKAADKFRAEAIDAERSSEASAADRKKVMNEIIDRQSARQP